jgi:hypothetical protein
MVSKLVGLTLFGLCVLHCSELHWVRECVAGHVKCKPGHTEDLCYWPAVLRSICYVGERLACRELPNNSFLFPYCMVSIFPVFPLQCRIRVYCLVCVLHTLKLGYWFLCIVCVLYVLLLLNFLIVLHMNCCTCYIITLAAVPSSHLGCQRFKSQPTDYVQVLHACPQFHHINTWRVTHTHFLHHSFRFNSY